MFYSILKRELAPSQSVATIFEKEPFALITKMLILVAWSQPLTCRFYSTCGPANIIITKRERLVDNTAEMGAYFPDTPHSSLDKSSIVGNIKELGLLLNTEKMALV